MAVLKEKLGHVSESLAIYCGNDALRRETVHLLKAADLQLTGSLMLVVDAPLGSTVELSHTPCWIGRTAKQFLN
jgi:hypothetical protein